MFVFHPAILLKKQWAEVKVNHSSPGYAIGLTKEDRDHFPHLGQDDTQRDHYICGCFENESIYMEEGRRKPRYAFQSGQTGSFMISLHHGGL